jgi:hypothetical protein
MAAAEKKIIIEKGADFSMEIALTNSAGGDKILPANSIILFSLFKFRDIDETGSFPSTISSPAEAATNVIVPAPDVVTAGRYKSHNAYTHDGTGNNILLELSREVTASLTTEIVVGRNQFNTEYNYYYHIDLVQYSDISPFDEIKGVERLMRGACAVRL